MTILYKDSILICIKQIYVKICPYVMESLVYHRYFHIYQAETELDGEKVYDNPIIFYSELNKCSALTERRKRGKLNEQGDGKHDQ